VVLVDGWENSAGARREVEVAAAHGIPIYDEQWVSDRDFPPQASRL
jgi:hypothetical protein